MKRLGFAVLAVALCAPAFAQGIHDQRLPEWAITAQEKKPPKPKADCSDLGGVKYDDGKFKDGVRPVLFDGELVMLFEAKTYPAKLSRICVNFWRFSFAARTLFFDVRIRAVNEDGTPGDLIATLPFQSITKFGLAGLWKSIDVSGLGLVIDGPVYIGPYFGDEFGIYLAYDAGPKTPRRRGFYGSSFPDPTAPPANELGVNISNVPKYRALGVRAVFVNP